jgi:hypothetical protein
MQKEMKHNCCKSCIYRHDGCFADNMRCEPEQWEDCPAKAYCRPCEYYEMEGEIADL